MRLSELMANSEITVMEQHGNGDPDITDIVYDSRKVSPGALYVSIPGTRVHGDTFIKDAIGAGAVAILAQTTQTIPGTVTLRVDNPRKCLGALGKALWNIDVDTMFMVGITGTNGKTSTAHLYRELLHAKYPHDNVWMFGTIEYHLGSQRSNAPNTTPEALDIFRFISSKQNRPRAIVMEVSSHSLHLDRIYGLEYDLAVWTNLTQDHLDFHKTMDSYFDAKKKLFCKHLKPDGVAVVNIDDQYGKKLLSSLVGKKTVTYGRSEQAQVRIVNHKCSWVGTEVTLDVSGTMYQYSSLLKGEYNVYNMTAMIAGAFGMGYSHEEISTALGAIRTVPGRMDRVEVDAPYSVVVDYAHTSDALVNVLVAARTLTEGRIICVFGCGGDRDRTKRPLMAQAVVENSDEMVITSDNPRTEKPMAILEEIVTAVPLDFPHRVIENRREAIHFALKQAHKGDCVIIAGKGHETYQEINGVKHHFDDKEVVMEYFQQQVRKDEYVSK